MVQVPFTATQDVEAVKTVGAGFDGDDGVYATNAQRGGGGVAAKDTDPITEAEAAGCHSALQMTGPTPGSFRATSPSAARDCSISTAICGPLYPIARATSAVVAVPPRATSAPRHSP